MLKLTSVLVLSALSLAAQAADLLTASAAPPAMSIGYVTEGAACPGPGATGFATSGLLLSCQSGVWREPEKTTIQSGRAYTSVCSAGWSNAGQSLCSAFPYVDIVFETPMQETPQILVSAEFLFPFTPCAQGATDAIDYQVTNLSKTGFRLYGGASPASTAIASCGDIASSGRAISLFSWIAISKKV